MTECRDENVESGITSVLLFERCGVRRDLFTGRTMISYDLFTVHKGLNLALTASLTIFLYSVYEAPFFLASGTSSFDTFSLYFMRAGPTTVYSLFNRFFIQKSTNLLAAVRATRVKMMMVIVYDPNVGMARRPSAR